MKITDPGIIKRGEQELLAAIKEELDLRAIEEMNKERFSSGNLECIGGDIVVHDNQVTYKMDFEVKARFSLLFDREGNIIHQESGVPAPTDSNREAVLEERLGDEILPEADITPISEETIADIEKELSEISTFNKEADDILASLGAEAEIGITVKPKSRPEGDADDLPLDESSLFEELELPSDDQPGVIEEVTASESPINELNTALEKSKDFWLTGSEASPEPKAAPAPETNELKMAFKKSQNFWLNPS